MKAREPVWHRLWRRALRERDTLKRLARAQKHFRPTLYARKCSGHDFWVRVSYEHQGAQCERMAAVVPLIVFGMDLSKVGLWRDQGSSCPLGRDSRDADFAPVKPSPAEPVASPA